MTRKIGIQEEFTGVVNFVEVAPEQRVGELMEDLKYSGMTLMADDFKLSLDETFVGGGGGPLFHDDAIEYRPFRLGVAE